MACSADEADGDCPESPGHGLWLLRSGNGERQRDTPAADVLLQAESWEFSRHDVSMRLSFEATFISIAFAFTNFDVYLFHIKI